MTNFNPELFKRVPKANTKVSTLSFQLRVNPTKGLFEFSQETFDELGLQDKGMSQILEPYNGKVVVSVDTLDVAVFLKGKGGKTKSPKFKNTELVDALIKNNSLTNINKVQYLNVDRIIHEGQPLTVNGSDFYTVSREVASAPITTGFNSDNSTEVEPVPNTEFDDDAL